MKALPSVHACCSPLQGHLQTATYSQESKKNQSSPHHLPAQQRKTQLISEQPSGPDPTQLGAGEEKAK